jgi:hypothetical protein
MRFSFFDPIEESPHHKCDAVVSREYRTLVNLGFRRESLITERDHIIKCDSPATHAYTVDGWDITSYRCNKHIIENSQAWKKLTLKEALVLEVLSA